MRNFALPLLTFVLLICLASCGGEYKNDGTEVTWHTWNEGNGHLSHRIDADPKTFEALKNNYGRDAVHAFFEGDIIEGADGSTFKTLGKWYASDDTHVYISGRLIRGADARTFKVRSDVRCHSLGEDKNDFYKDTIALNVRDKATFEVLKTSHGQETFYARDKYNGYYMDGTVIPGVDAQTFHPIDDPFSLFPCYAADKNKVYYDGEEVPMADPATFKTVDLDVGQDKHRCYIGKTPTHIKDYTKLEKIGRFMYTDGTNIYNYTLDFKILPEADVHTFEYIAHNWYKDKNHVWWCSDLLPGADPRTFKPVDISTYITGKIKPYGSDFYYGKDAEHVFYCDSIIPGADPSSFERIDFNETGNWTVFDKNRIYEGKETPRLREYLEKKYGK